LSVLQCDIGFINEMEKKAKQMCDTEKTNLYS